MKKLILISFIFVLLFVGIFPVYAIEFSDVSEGFWGYESIDRLSYAKIINGYPDKTFKPDNQVTRAEFFKMVTVTQLEANELEVYKKDMVNWYDPYVDFIYERCLPVVIKYSTDDIPITRYEIPLIQAMLELYYSTEGENRYNLDVQLNKLKNSDSLDIYEKIMLDHILQYNEIYSNSNEPLKLDNIITNLETAMNISRNDVDIPITRKEATLILATFAKEIGLDGEYEYETDLQLDNFKDINNFDDYEKNLFNYILKCNLIYGYPDGTFRPDNTITRAEAATLIYRFCKVWVSLYNGGSM